MKYCKRCTMPDTRPGITFDEEGVCSACRHYENRSKVDWAAREREFAAFCDKYRGCNGPGGYDCAVAVSGGKDSHYQVYMLKEVYHMNPILFTVEDNFPMTDAGIHNLKNISEEFSCTLISCKPNIKVQKKLMRHFFEKYGKPTWYVDRLIYTYPLHMALKFNTPMLCYGENVSFEYGGNADEETYSARDQIENGVAAYLNVIALAESQEIIYTPDSDEGILLPRSSPVLHLLQRIRDEAHRFAISYHRSLHQRNALLSVLDGIEGIGDTRKRALFDAFITRDAIAGASVAELSKVKGMSRPAAEAVYRFFHPADDINDTEKKG